MFKFDQKVNIFNASFLKRVILFKEGCNYFLSLYDRRENLENKAFSVQVCYEFLYFAKVKLQF